jgi:hypothetical protein
VIVSKPLNTLRDEGLSSFAWRVGKWMANRRNPYAPVPLETVYREDVIAVDWTTQRDFNSAKVARPKTGYNIAWVISPPSAIGGGHHNAWRFMKFLEDAGHNLTLYYYSAPKFPKFTLDGIRRTLDDASAFPKLKAEMRMYSPEVGIEGDFHAVVASDWATAYAAYRYSGTAKRFYFVQDFEPVFFPAGSDFVVAENSYRFGFHGLTVGPWLSQKLTREYGMKADHYDYAVDSKFYTRTNDSRRDDVIFYARPTTPRRATEFGLLVLEEFHRQRPEVTIHLAGWDMSDYNVPFAYVNHGAMDVRELPPLYNQCAAALSISLTSSSLFPFEVMACGVQPVVNDADNTRFALGNNAHIDFVPLSPQAMARALISAIDRPDQVEHSRKISSSFSDVGWSDSGTQFVDAFVRVMTGGK